MSFIKTSFIACAQCVNEAFFLGGGGGFIVIIFHLFQFETYTFSHENCAFRINNMA